MKYAYRLNISTDGALKYDLTSYFADKQDQDITRRNNNSDPNPPISIFNVKNATDIINSDWLKNVQSVLPEELYLLDHVMVFVRRTNVSFNAHFDVMTLDPPSLCVFALNFTLLDEDESDMVWYQKKDGSGIDINSINFFGNIKKDLLQEIGRSSIGKDDLTLVNTCDFHDIDNHGGKPRWCISLRTNMPYKTWEEAVEAFRRLIK